MPENEGASPDLELLSSAVHEAILNFQETLSLEDAGVYKCTPEGREGFDRFLKSVGFAE